MEHTVERNGLKFGFRVPFYPLDLIYSSTLLAENEGFDSAWSADHMVGISTKHRESFSAWEIMSSLAVKTKKILLGTSVSDPCRLHPAIIAQLAMTLACISGNRFSLGMGAGEAQNNSPYGIDCTRPVKRLEESLEIIQELLKGDEVNHNGEFFDLHHAVVSPALNKGDLKLWMGANSPKTMRMTSKLADGWLPIAAIFPPEQYRGALEKIQGEAQRKIEGGLFLHVSIAKSEDKASMMAEQTGKLQLLGWVPQVFKDQLSEETQREFHFKNMIFDESTSRKLDEILKKLPMEPVLERLAVGTPDQCLEKIDSFVKAGATHIVASFMCPPDQLLECLRLYKSKILSYYEKKK